MKIWPLRVFLKVLELGSLQAAARELHRTPPALSMALQKLEDDVGFALLDRSGYRLQVTERGAQVRRHAEALLRQHERLNSVIHQLRAGAEPQLRITYDYTCNPELLLTALMAVQQQFPVTEVMVSGHSQLEALAELQQGNADLALTPWLPTFQQLADFESLRVVDFRLVVVLANSLVVQHGMPTSQEALSALPYILPRELKMGISPEKIYRLTGSSRLRVNDAHTLVKYLKAGLGWGVVPRDLVAHELASGQLRLIDIPGFLDHIHAEVHLVKLASQQLGPAGNLVWQQFVERELQHTCS